MSLSPPVRALLVVGLAALAAYANSLGNGFAYDDEWVVESNPVVTDARLGEAFDSPYWPQSSSGTGNYRPLTLLSFAGEWAASGGHPLLFHAVSVVAHIAVSLLVVLLLLGWTGLLPAIAGGLVFALHPVHVEAVANVVGRAELYAALAVLAAVLLYRGGRDWTGWRRGLRWSGILALYAVGLGSKEMAVTLPAILVALELWRPGEGAEGQGVAGLVRELPLYLLMVGVAGTYLVLRWNVLGALTGESAAAGLAGLDTGGRLLTALSIWPEYLRLMVFPVDLSMDYRPGVLEPVTAWTPRVFVGALILGSLILGALRLRRSAPMVSFGMAWFVVTVLPVSNLIVRSDVLLAERTLYLPSVGLALVVAGGVVLLRKRMDRDGERLLAAALVLAMMALFARTLERNPTWDSTTSAMATLVAEHPESYRFFRTQALRAEAAGDLEQAHANWSRAVTLVPDDYVLMVEAAVFAGRVGLAAEADSLFGRATGLLPDYPAAYRRWAEHLLRTGRARDAHATALRGLAGAGADRELYALVSESYIARGDLEAALRARRAAAARPGATRNDLERAAELLDALGRPDEAAAARRHATTLPEAPAPERIP